MRRFLALAVLTCAAAGNVSPSRPSTVGSIHGTVADLVNRRPIAVRLNLVSLRILLSATSDAHGFYSFVGVAPDTYELSAQAASYRSFSEPGITVSQDSNIAIDIAMQRTALATRDAASDVRERMTSEGEGWYSIS